MLHEKFSGSNTFEHRLFCMRIRHLSAIDLVLLEYLHHITASDGCGYLKYYDMGQAFNRAVCTCRRRVRKLKREGWIEGTVADGRGGAHFRLAEPDDGFYREEPGRNQSANDIEDEAQHVEKVLPAGVEPVPRQHTLAPKCSAA